MITQAQMSEWAYSKKANPELRPLPEETLEALREFFNSRISFNETNEFLAIANEAEDAVQQFGEFASLHEAYGVLWEEVHELFDQVRKKQMPEPVPMFGTNAAWREPEKIRNEAIQIAAVAYRIALDADRLARK